MKLTEICIRRPVLSTVLSLVLVIIGYVTYDRLQIRHYPRMDFPRISVITGFEGASPDIIESQVTKQLENALASINGIESMESKSGNGESRITLTFTIDRDIESAANDVRDKVGRARVKFPADVQNSLIRKADADAVPMMNLVLFSDEHPIKDVSDYARNTLESQLQVVPGVAAVDIWGGGEYKMYIRLDPVKMASFQITAEDVAKALKEQTFEKPAGYLITEDRQITVTTKASLKTEEEFENVIIDEREGYLVRIRDVATEVSFDAVEEQFYVRYNGKEAVTLAITRQSTANDLDISKEINRILPRIQQNLPSGMKLEIANDTSIFIDRSIQEVMHTIFEASALVILVIFIFLRTFRASIIPIVTIPLSLIGTFAIMYLFGFTINVLTLLALVMAIGLVVDDAIVILENIYRHIEEGMKPLEAAFKGSQEIGHAVIAMTITLAAVYLPIALSTGMTGKIFTEFAVTLAGAVFLSGFIALTLSPMMCSRFLTVHHPKVTQDERKHHKVVAFFKAVDIWIDRALDHIDDTYERTLKSFSRLWIIVGAVGVALIGIYVGMNMKQDLSTPEDQGFVKARAFPPRGASLQFINKYMQQGENILNAFPEIDKTLTMIQTRGDSTIESYLVPWEDRDRSSLEISNLTRPKFHDITGMSFNVWGASRSLTGGGRGKPIEIIVQTTKSYDELITLFKDYVNELRKLPGIDDKNVEDTISSEEQEYAIKIDREKAASMNVDVIRVGEMLDTLISGHPVTYFKTESFRYPVTIELAKEFRKTREDISGLYVRSIKRDKQTMVPLAEIVTVEKQLVPTEIYHFGGLRAATVYAELTPGHGLKEILDNAMLLAQRMLPEGSKIDFSGESKRFIEESANVFFIFLLAVISIYLVLAAQYESFIDPLIIMVSVPLSLVGGLLTLMFAGGSFQMVGGMPTFETGTLTIFAKIGLVTLIGLITKHGILIVEFANKLIQEEGQSRADAVVNAAKVRLRPILMTTFAMVLGAVPLAIASGAGAESRQQIGWVIVGGMSIGTLFTLYVVPAFYVYLSRENLVSLLFFWRKGHKLSQRSVTK